MSAAEWMDLYLAVSRHRDEVQRRADELMWAIFAGEDATMFGTRVQITVAWPDGLPRGYTDAEAFRTFATDQLAKIRGSGVHGESP